MQTSTSSFTPLSIPPIQHKEAKRCEHQYYERKIIAGNPSLDLSFDLENDICRDICLDNVQTLYLHSFSWDPVVCQRHCTIEATDAVAESDCFVSLGRFRVLGSNREGS
ncbi:hypothetical protein D6D29_01600 [Aureobasidium pullulans]|nr:hypothetical protein D6D29_01600 [Aureobasidium pullulans]THV91150.1 hypothetical protein D6D27_05437 [Aureobasidium pullulans]